MFNHSTNARHTTAIQAEKRRLAGQKGVSKSAGSARRLTKKGRSQGEMKKSLWTRLDLAC